jgi:hypothetical protein
MSANPHAASAICAFIFNNICDEFFVVPKHNFYFLMNNNVRKALSIIEDK